MRRTAWLAGLSSVLLPGLGQTYNGQLRRGLRFYVLLWVTGLISLLVLLYAPGAPFNVLLPSALFLAAWIAVIRDAIVTARGIGEQFELRAYNRWYIYVAAVLITGFVVQPLVESTAKGRIAESVSIPTAAMEPTLLPGDYLLVSKGSYRHAGPDRGQLVVFEAPHEPGTMYLKRVVGLPGDTLQMRDKALFVNGTSVTEPYVQHLGSVGELAVAAMLWQRDYVLAGTANRDYWPTRDNWGPLTVPTDQYFVLGDNRDDSVDSRYYGFVAKQNVIGEPKRLYFSWEPTTHRVRWDRIGRGVR